MQEIFLQYCWKHQLFNTQNKQLQTSNGQEIKVIQPGEWNTRLSGPDFSNSQVVIEGMRWFGAVEIHLKASDWKAHQHEGDQNYEAVILHVVWQKDCDIYHKDGSLIPTLELQGKIPSSLIQKAETLLKSEQQFPACANHLGQIPRWLKISMVEKALVERLEARATTIREFAKAADGLLEAGLYRWLCRCLSFGENTEAMIELSGLAPWKVIRKIRHQAVAVEALLLGQAGLLAHIEGDAYAEQQIQIYDELRVRYDLPHGLKLQRWKHAKIRPHNWPERRLALLAAILCQRDSLHNIFSAYPAKGSKEILNQLLAIEGQPYWRENYSFGKPAPKASPLQLGSTLGNTLLSNVIPPYLVALQQEGLLNNGVALALGFLEQMPPEENRVTKAFSAQGIPNLSAFDSQGLLELGKNYCQALACMRCRIGEEILG